MTTRELQEAIKKAKQLEQQLEEERRKPPKEIQVTPPDYNLLKSRLEIKDQKIEDLTKQIEILELKANANEKDAEELARLKADIRTLTKERTDIGRQIRSATELSGLVAEAQMFFRGKLAPVKYSRAIQEAVEDDTVRQNLTEILDIFSGWIDEMKRYTYPKPYMMGSKEIIEMEVNENE
jgi:DNA repair exonuclease SbcCD ATPase subunit